MSGYVRACARVCLCECIGNPEMYWINYLVILLVRQSFGRNRFCATSYAGNSNALNAIMTKSPHITSRTSHFLRQIATRVSFTQINRVMLLGIIEVLYCVFVCHKQHLNTPTEKIPRGVIRDLTLRVFAITRFRGKKAVRKLYSNFAVTVYGGDVTVWRAHQLVTFYQYQCERECWCRT
jgi:hypothetical protein